MENEYEQDHFNTYGGFKFYQQAGTTPLMVIGGNGSTNVGIGTAAPAAPLDVYGTPYTSGVTGGGGLIRVFDTTSATTGTGGGIDFTGYYNTTASDRKSVV